MPGQRGPVPVSGEDGTRPVTQEILNELETRSNVSSAEFQHVPLNEFKAALDRLASREMIQYSTEDTEQVLLTEEGELICEQGSHEFKVWDAVKRNGKLEIKDLVKEIGDSAKVGQGTAMKNRWVKKDGAFLLPAVESVQDNTRRELEAVRKTKAISDPKVLAEYRKRKLVHVAKVITYIAKQGPRYAKTMPIEVTDLTDEMLRDGSWQTANFKPYNFHALGGAQSAAGALHPINKMREEIRRIFFSLGFVEMPTNRYVESGFWNFDTLFVPQQHPARDLQDTFFVSDPPMADRPRPDPEMEKQMDIMERRTDRLFGTTQAKEPRKTSYEQFWENTVAVHEGRDGDNPAESIGYRYPWSGEECLRLVLRTHTTALSSWALHRLASAPRPARYFSIDRVFRNETVDATHLAEFHQVEGVIAQDHLSLPDGMGFLADFFGELGLEDIEFKPAYNPYTEPSLEVFAWHPGLKKKIEIGNSGVFRPEMVQSMGLPKDLRVFGFGLSVERPTMIRYGLRNIRDLVGHKVSLDFIENNPAIRLDKV